MKSEIIYKRSSSWFGRWGEDEGSEIIIAADFINPAQWPYTAKRREYADDVEKVNKTFKLSKDLFYKVKDVIASQRNLATCSTEVHNGGRDLSDDSYFFSCDSFTKEIYGASIYSVGYHEAEGPSRDWTANYYVYKAVNDIEKTLKDGGVDIWS